jgi:hypothetical protein
MKAAHAGRVAALGLIAAALFAGAGTARAQEPTPSPTATPTPAPTATPTPAPPATPSLPPGCALTGAGITCSQLPAGCVVTSAGLHCPGGVLPETAGNASPTPTPTGNVAPESTESPAPPAPSDPPRALPARLPFTGPNGGPIALLGAALFGAGLLLRQRMDRP